MSRVRHLCRLAPLVAFVAACGLVGCVVLAFTLPTASVVAGSSVFIAGALWWGVVGRHRSARGDRPAP